MAMALALTRGRLVGALFFGMVGLIALGNIVSPPAHEDRGKAQDKNGPHPEQYAAMFRKAKLSDNLETIIPSSETSLRRAHRW